MGTKKKLKEKQLKKHINHLANLEDMDWIDDLERKKVKKELTEEGKKLLSKKKHEQ